MDFADLPETIVGPVSETLFYAESDDYPRSGLSFLLLRGKVDVEALAQATQRAHYAFPATISRLKARRFGLQRLLVRVPASAPPSLRVVDDFAESLGDRTYEDAITEIFEPLYVRRIDLFNELPSRFYLVRFPDDYYALVFYCHHIVTDAGTTFAIMRTVMAAYHELVAGEAAEWARIGDMASTGRSLQRHSVWRVLRDMREESGQLKKHPVIWFGKKVEFTSPARRMAGFTLTEDETKAMMKKARGMGATVNDLVSVSVVQLIDEEMGAPEGTLSLWMPANVRVADKQARSANYSTAININLIREERLDEQTLLKCFIARRKALLESGRPYVNMTLLKKLMSFIRLFPIETRTPWMRKILYRPMTFVFSNAGIVWPKKIDGKFTPYSEITSAGGVEIVHFGYNFSTSGKLGQGLVAHTFNGRFSTFYSVNKQLMSRDEGQKLMARLKNKLIG